MLAFRRVDIIIAQIGAPPDLMPRVLVCWELVTQHSQLDETTFHIERSLSPQFTEGEYDDLGNPVSGVPGTMVYEAIDSTVNLASFWRRYFYRIRAETPEGTVLSDAVTWQTEPRPHELEIIRRNDLILRFFQGVPSFAFVERTTDAAFCECYDLTAGRVTRSNCTLCLGTGRQRPYFEPIPMFVDYNPDEELVSVSNFGEMQPKEKDCWISAFPRVKPGDLIYEVMPALLWRIARVHTVQPMRTTIQQVCRVNALERSEVEYRRIVQRIPEETLKDLVQQWERLKEERMF